MFNKVDKENQFDRSALVFFNWCPTISPRNIKKFRACVNLLMERLRGKRVAVKDGKYAMH